MLPRRSRPHDSLHNHNVKHPQTKTNFLFGRTGPCCTELCSSINKNPIGFHLQLETGASLHCEKKQNWAKNGHNIKFLFSVWTSELALISFKRWLTCVLLSFSQIATTSWARVGKQLCKRFVQQFLSLLVPISSFNTLLWSFFLMSRSVVRLKAFSYKELTSLVMWSALVLQDNERRVFG